MKLSLLTEQQYWTTYAPNKYKNYSIIDPEIGREDHIKIARRAGLDNARKALQFIYNMSLRDGSVDRVARLRQILNWIKREIYKENGQNIVHK